jgi:hypothetical protein
MSALVLVTAAAGAGERNPIIVWSAHHETGDLSEWTIDGLGGEYDTRSGDATVTNAVAYRGRFALALSIRDANGETGSQATRMFRWGYAGRPLPQAAYYGAWFYFPRRWEPSVYWNIMQWKTKVSPTATLPVMTLNVGSRSGRMFLYLYDHVRDVNAGRAPIELRPRRWTHIQAYYRFAPDATGRVVLYQDDRKIITADGVETELPSTEVYARQWSINNYTNGLSPSSATIYIDDAAISLRRIGNR